jgi:cytochrome c-type biogenesis protein CcmH/NrfG
LRRHYLLAGVALALALAAVVVAVGLRSGGGSGVAGAAGTSVLPSGHPGVTEATADSSPVPDTGTTIEKTIARLETESAAHPKDVATLLKLGEAYFVSQHNRLAERTFAEVLAVDPGNDTAKVRLAMAWHAAGDTKRAEKAIAKVLAAKPDDQEAHYSLAIIYFSTDRSAQARDEWLTAAKLDPKSVIGRRSQSFVDLLDGQESKSANAGD